MKIAIYTKINNSPKVIQPLGNIRKHASIKFEPAKEIATHAVFILETCSFQLTFSKNHEEMFIFY